jgi:DNA-binding NarL/FixJ family response regulator
VGEAADGEAAVREVQLTRPDVVLMDIRMPGLDGLEATRRIRATSPGVAVLVLTMLDDDDTVFATMRAGGQGYVLKGAAQGEIDRAIRAVARGELIFSPGVAARVLGHFSSPPSAGGTAFPGLTAREREVLDRIAAGRRNAAIADELCISPKTVANHISSIFAKLAVADRAEAIVLARRQGLGDGQRP